MPTLQVAGLCKRFGKTLAVDSLDLTANSGEIVALLGPNGAGKSTSFLCLSGMMRPDSGKISWENAVLSTNRGRTIALIPETPEVYTLLTVWEHLVFVAKSCRLAEGWEERARELLERLNITDQRDTLGAALSKGMRQKTLIAATLLADAPVLLFDEPMIGLDPAGQRELRAIFSELRQQGKAIIVSTHMLEAAKAIADRAVVLKAGHTIFTGSFAAMETLGTSDIESTFLEMTT
ncbi:MAG: ABC transporter ATP-binding protein [Vulcanimicrobiaceae bacterium]